MVPSSGSGCDRWPLMAGPCLLDLGLSAPDPKADPAPPAGTAVKLDGRGRGVNAPTPLLVGPSTPRIERRGCIGRNPGTAPGPGRDTSSPPHPHERTAPPGLDTNHDPGRWNLDPDYSHPLPPCSVPLGPRTGHLSNAFPDRRAPTPSAFGWFMPGRRRAVRSRGLDTRRPRLIRHRLEHRPHQRRRRTLA